MSPAGRFALVFVAVLCLFPVAATGGTAAAGGPIGADSAFSGPAADADNRTNETPRHQNPDEYEEDGDLEGLESWLAGQLSDRLGESAIEISQGEYDLAREHVGDEYRERLGQYVDVAGETEDDSREETFEETREQQERLADDVEEYEETRDEYERARDDGDDDRARELARDLEELSQRIDDSSTTVRENYAELEAATGTDFSEPDDAIEETNTQIQEEQATIREGEFVETELLLAPDGEAISFTEPLTVRGEIRTADDSTIANEAVTFRVGDAVVDGETDAGGAVSFEYRPAHVPANTTELSIRYVPAPDSAYLGSETTVPVSIEQVEPEIADIESTPEAAYGDDVRVAGSVTVDGVAVDGVELEITADGERLGTANVSEGEFDEALSLPAAVPDGERTLTVRLPYEDRALAATEESTVLTVGETDSTLSVEASYREENGTVTAGGRLETADGAGVGDEPVHVRLDGTTVGTFTTADDGAFEGTVSVPDDAAGDVEVVAVYEGAGSNVAPAQASTSAALPTASEPESPFARTATLALVTAGSLCLAAVVWWRRRRPRDESAPAGTAGGAPAGTQAAETADAGGSAIRTLLERASEQLSRGRPEDAVVSCYGAVRRELEARSGPGQALTHWEFYRRARSTGLDDEEGSWLRAVTEGYERAAFGREGVSGDEASGVLERARRLCDFGDGTGGAESSDE